MIPTLDVREFTLGNTIQKESFTQQLGKAFHDVGFVAIKGHYREDQVTEDPYKHFRTFFELGDVQKEAYHLPGLAGQRGCTGKMKEHAKGHSKGDLKEFFHVGQPSLSREDLALLGYPENVWPREVPLWKDTATQAYLQLLRTGIEILKAIALYLALPEEYFTPFVSHGNSLLRAIHYFPVVDTEWISEGAVRAAAHEDINLITLLMGASADGLQILNKSGGYGYP